MNECDKELHRKKDQLHDLATEIWAAAQLAPNDGMENGIKRIVEILTLAIGRSEQ